MFDNLAAIDHFFAKTLLDALEDEELYLCLCYLMYLSRNGHLCVKIDKGKIDPDEIEDHLLTKKIIRGFQRLPKSLCSQDAEDINKPLFKDQNSIYLQKNWVFERKIVEKIKECFTECPDQNIDCLMGYRLLETYDLLLEQKKAIEHAFENRLTILCGGPGTGKSYCASRLVEIFSKISKEKTFEITIAALTGKAVSHLGSKIDSTYSFQSKTLHSLLSLSHWKNFSFDKTFISSDLLIVDEASMIDIKVFACLFSALKKGSRLVLIGDPNQLPPIEAGTVFADLAMHNSLHLKQNIRVKNSKLNEFANHILSGNTDQCIQYLQEKKIPFSDFDFSRDLPIFLLDHFLSLKNDPADIFAIYEAFQKFRILSCIRQGPFGVNALNETLFQHYVKKAQKGQPLAVPIVITQNDYQLELYNGMTGVLLIHENKKTIYVQIDNQMKAFSAYALPGYEYGFVLSIHKSQGSEFKDVLVIVPPGSENFGREILYTAVTRAKENLKIISSIPIIRKVIRKTGKKTSGIFHSI